MKVIDLVNGKPLPVEIAKPMCTRLTLVVEAGVAWCFDHYDAHCLGESDARPTHPCSCNDEVEFAGLKLAGD